MPRDTTTLGLLRLNDIVGCILPVELAEFFATGVPKAGRREEADLRARKGRVPARSCPAWDGVAVPDQDPSERRKSKICPAG